MMELYHRLLVQHFADFFHVTEDFTIRTQNAGLVVGDALLFAKLLHENICFAQIVTWHVWKQMMLDLVIETAIHKVCERMGDQVAGCQNLLAEKVDFLVFADDEHALVVWCEHHAHVQAPGELVEEKEQDSDPEGQKCHQNGDKNDVMGHDEGKVEPHLAKRLAQAELHALLTQAVARETQDEEKEPMLTLHNETLQAFLLECLIWTEGEDRNFNIRIHVLVIWMRVMFVVLCDPVFQTPSEQECRDVSNDGITFCGTENLMMTCVMRQERDLSQDEREEECIKHVEPCPIRKNNEAEDHENHESGLDHLSRVIQWLPIEVSTCDHQATKLCKITRGSGDGECEHSSIVGSSNLTYNEPALTRKP